MGPTPRTGSPPVDKHDIKALLGKRGLTLADVGRLCEPEVSRQAVSAVLARDSTSEGIEVVLALACGLSLGDIQNVTRRRPSRGGNDSDTDSDIRSARVRSQARVSA